MRWNLKEHLPYPIGLKVVRSSGAERKERMDTSSLMEQIDGIYEQFLKGTKIEDCIEKAKVCMLKVIRR